jgi:hypothetical protein
MIQIQTLTPEQFLFWLRGYLEAKPDPTVAADVIATKAGQVRTLQNYPWTLNQPIQWYGGQPISGGLSNPLSQPFQPQKIDGFPVPPFPGHTIVCNGTAPESQWGFNGAGAFYNK